MIMPTALYFQPKIKEKKITRTKIEIQHIHNYHDYRLLITETTKLFVNQKLSTQTNGIVIFFPSISLFLIVFTLFHFSMT